MQPMSVSFCFYGPVSSNRTIPVLDLLYSMVAAILPIFALNVLRIRSDSFGRGGQHMSCAVLSVDAANVHADRAAVTTIAWSALYDDG